MNEEAATIPPELLPLISATAADAQPGHGLRALPSDRLPQPYRSLLDHDKDMTGTLAAHFGGPIELEPLQVVRAPQHVLRRIRLRSRDAGRVAEYGLIRIHLASFDVLARERILAADRPLGSILQAHAVPFLSRPRAFLELGTPSSLRACFGIEHARVLFGRYNVLLHADGRPLAEALEILPFLDQGATAPEALEP